MINRRFHFKLRELKDANGRRWTVGRMAETMFVSRTHLNCVLNNQRGGAASRRKVVKFLKLHLPQQEKELLNALGWNEEGQRATGTENIQQPTSNAQQPMKEWEKRGRAVPTPECST